MIEARRGGSVGGEGNTSSSIRLLPYAPQDTDEWTEEIYAVYHQAQIAVGLRREPTEDEIKSQKLLSEIDDAIETGDSWIDKVRDYFGDDDDEEFNIILDNDDVIESIAQELREAENGTE